MVTVRPGGVEGLATKTTVPVPHSSFQHLTDYRGTSQIAASEAIIRIYVRAHFFYLHQLIRQRWWSSCTFHLPLPNDAVEVHQLNQLNQRKCGRAGEGIWWSGWG